MFPMHRFGKARQKELLRLAEPSADTLLREPDDLEYSGDKQATSLAAAVEAGETASAPAGKKTRQKVRLKEGVFSKFLQLLGKVRQTL